MVSGCRGAWPARAGNVSRCREHRRVRSSRKHSRGALPRDIHVALPSTGPLAGFSGLQPAQPLADRVVTAGVCPNRHQVEQVADHRVGAVEVDPTPRRRDADHDVVAGAVPAHSEAVVYEWVQSADSPEFKPILQLVKELSLG